MTFTSPHKAFFLFLLLAPLHALAWECDVTVTGPKTIKLDEQITLSALGTPAGGSYSWSRTPNLVPSGSTATLTGFKPTYSEYIRVIGYYTSPKGKKCHDTIWVWACNCTVNNLTGPTTANVGQEVTLTAEAEPTGGIFTWSINSGSGTINPTGSSALFIGDKVGSVEIKVSYLPADGGKPCDKYHTIQVNEDCQITLTGDWLQRPVCRAANYSAQGEPAGGTCEWTAANGINGTDCSASYTSQTPGEDTVTVTYTTPGGTTCNDSNNILTYFLKGMVSNKQCFDSGSVLQLSDFDIFISPDGFTFQPTLSPETVTTNMSREQVRVTASPLCDTGSSNDVSTVIEVVNNSIKTTSGIRVEIPNLITEPLELIGIADKLRFEVQSNYNMTTECCTNGPVDSTDGETAVRVIADFGGLTLVGVPLPPAAKKYVTLDLLQAKLSGRAITNVKGESEPCEAKEYWTGGGSFSVRLELNAEAKVTLPKKYLLLQGKVGGRTEVSQTMTVQSSRLDVTGKWLGLTAAGKIKVQVFGYDAPEFFVTRTLFPGKETPPYSIDLPSLN